MNIEELKAAKDAAWQEYERRRAPEQAAWKEYEKAANAYKEAVLYAKAKRKVMRELIQSAGNQADTEIKEAND